MVAEEKVASTRCRPRASGGLAPASATSNDLPPASKRAHQPKLPGKQQGQCEPPGRGPARPIAREGGRCLAQGRQRPRQARPSMFAGCPIQPHHAPRHTPCLVLGGSCGAHGWHGCCTVAQEEPGTLQVGHLRQLSQKSLPHFKAVCAPCLRVLSSADGRAQGDQLKGAIGKAGLKGGVSSEKRCKFKPSNAAKLRFRLRGV